MDIRDQVYQYVVETFLFGDGSRIKDDDSLTGSGLIDSTGVIELVSYLERTFNLRIEDDEIIPDNFDSVARISNFISAKQAGEAVARMKVAFAE
ncbi:MAG TPA: acyl carrier protein [bacterium]|nr:acyl carrier protein [bacterium]HQG44478.1 acyl carrier protein [bacterium]HQI47418.1 acyl carrier protein [bacterium]HQJ63832.1 acyl carrier protein [bacterium]